jgi:hypothetical protein
MMGEFHVEGFRSLLNMSKDKITKAAYVNLSLRDLQTRDDYEDAARELLHFLINHEYYDTIDRIETGEALYAAETDPIKRKRYKARLDELKAKLETLTLKGDAA